VASQAWFVRAPRRKSVPAIPARATGGAEATRELVCDAGRATRVRFAAPLSCCGSRRTSSSCTLPRVARRWAVSRGRRNP
jgi:hypothetical protein